MNKRGVSIFLGLLVFSFLVVQFFSMLFLSGVISPVGHITNNGKVEMCIHRYPIIHTENQSGKIGERFRLDLNITQFDDNTIRFMQNDSFFSLGFYNGLIDFVPIDSEVGVHDILITLIEEGECTGYNITKVIRFTFNSTVIPSSSGGGAGGGGGGGESIKKPECHNFIDDDSDGQVDLDDSDCTDWTDESESSEKVEPLIFEKPFSFNPRIVKVSVVQGETTTKIVKFTNLLYQDIKIYFSIVGLDNILLSDKSKVIPLRDEYFLTMDFSASINEPVDVYSGRLFVDYYPFNFSDVVLLYKEVRPRILLFDLGVFILPDYKFMSPGADFVIANISLKNLGSVIPVNVTLFYAVKNFEGITLVQNSETLTIDDELFSIKSLDIKDKLGRGDYIFYAKIITDGNVVAIASDDFSIGSTPFVESPSASAVIGLNNLWWLWIIFIFVFIVLNTCIIYLHKKKDHYHLLSDHLVKNSSNFDSVVQYVKAELGKGFSVSEIKSALNHVGHEDFVINGAIEEAKKVKPN